MLKLAIVVAVVATVVVLPNLRSRTTTPAVDRSGRQIGVDSVAPTKFVQVLGKRMAYVEIGEGEPIVFMHGNPSLKYLWRNIMPHVCPKHGRCIAPDLIGMGESEKIPGEGFDGRYSFHNHSMYLDAFLKELKIDCGVRWVVHDWGSGLGLDWISRHLKCVKSFAFMDAVIGPEPLAELPLMDSLIFQYVVRNPVLGPLVMYRLHALINYLLPEVFVQRELTQQELAVYAAPYVNGGEDRAPLLHWAAQVPRLGVPEATHNVIKTYTEVLENSDVPKLWIPFEPGQLLTAGGDMAKRVSAWKNTAISPPAQGTHFAQEDEPHKIGIALEQFFGAVASGQKEVSDMTFNYRAMLGIKSKK
jgi:haloalkane dehalogenase